MDKPLTDAELDELDNSHCDRGGVTGLICTLCGCSYPCPTVSAIAELRALREQNAALVTALEAIQDVLSLPYESKNDSYYDQQSALGMARLALARVRGAG